MGDYGRSPRLGGTFGDDFEFGATGGEFWSDGRDRRESA
jgi:hypothetical protein